MNVLNRDIQPGEIVIVAVRYVQYGAADRRFRCEEGPGMDRGANGKVIVGHWLSDEEGAEPSRIDSETINVRDTLKYQREQQRERAKVERAKLPRNWRQICKRILARAGHRCEQCGLRSGAWGWREGGSLGPGGFHEIHSDEEASNAVAVMGERPFHIKLTVAHIDYDPAHNEDDNLKALCQKCLHRHETKRPQA